MAIYETKTVQCANDPKVIDALTREMGLFFWSVQSQQITDRKSSHTEFSDAGTYISQKIVTETANYATITFQRDKLIPRYAEVQKLENELKELRAKRNSADYDENDLRSQRRKIRIALIVALFILIFVIAILNLSDVISIILDILVFGGVIGGFVLTGKYYSPRIKSAETILSEIPQDSSILDSAESLYNQIITDMRK